MGRWALCGEEALVTLSFSVKSGPDDTELGHPGGDAGGKSPASPTSLPPLSSSVS